MNHPAFSLVVLALAAVLMGGCDSSSGGGGSSAPDPVGSPEVREGMLLSIGTAITEQLGEVVSAMDALTTATQAYAGSLSDDDRGAAQEAWAVAMATWQRLELAQIGPAGPMSTVAGGEDLRDAIYSWPLVNPCRVDQETVEMAYADTGAFAMEPVNVRGLDAMEYLLFHDASDNACAPNSGINADGDWAALSEDEIRQRRADYAAALAAMTAERADTLRARWAADGGGFLSQLTVESTDTYSNQQEALNALSDALFYLDKEVKDMKLAVPTGLTECTEATCPDAVESPWSQTSLANVRNNIDGFALIYFGGNADDESAVGFHDLLIDVGATDLAEGIAIAIDDIYAAFDSVDTSMVAALEVDLDAVIEIHDRIKTLTDLLKTQFVSVLDLELPDRAAGDND